MTQANLAVHEAILLALRAGQATPIYDVAPDNTNLPFIEIVSQSVSAADALDAGGDLHTVFLAIWSSHNGQCEVLGINASISSVLHNADLDLAGDSHAVFCRVSSSQANPEPDGKTYQGAVTVQVRVDHE